MTRLFGAVAVLSLTLAAVHPALAGSGCVILQYHQFGEDTPSSTSVTPARFEDHLAYLERHGYAVLPVEKIVSRLRRGEEVPENCVGITVDDAYRSVYERAFPLLERKGFPFTVFVATEGVDRGFRDYMTWEQMREMRGRGASFASHGHSHDNLVERRAGETEEEWAARVKRDIELSLERLRQEIGPVPELFAYPYGEYDTALRNIVGKAGLSAFGQQSGALWTGSDFLALPRFPMAAAYADMEQFVDKVRSCALPVIAAEPEDPVLPAGQERPVLRLSLATGEYRPETLACYAGGQGRIEVRRVDREALVFEVRASRPLPAGRSRYNCTARHRSENRYFWYSHPWIRRPVSAPGRRGRISPP